MVGRIEDYALIGDTHTAALVGIDGSIDWLCLPRFDSGAAFAALLGRPDDHGRWLLAPAGGIQHVERKYREDTLVLETTFHTDTGVVRITDCMPIRRRNVDVVRVVEGVAGRVPMRMDLRIRFDYGFVLPWVVPARRVGCTRRRGRTRWCSMRRCRRPASATPPSPTSWSTQASGCRSC